MNIDTVVVLGGGFTARAVLRLANARGLWTRAVVRDAERAKAVFDLAEVTVMPVFDAKLATLASASTHVVVTFPPDGETDARLDLRAGAITYVSSTGVFGEARGIVDDTTPVTSTPSPTAARRIEAEAIWHARGATILRCPAIYGPDRGLHRRVVSGQHKIPGDGSGHVSRIHVDDLAALILAAPKAPGETFVVGDLAPARHRDVVAWICERYDVPMPPSIPLEQAHESLRGDRRVDASRALRTLGVTLAYPTYEIGYAPAAAASSAT